MPKRCCLVLLPLLLFFYGKAQDTLFTYFFNEQLKTTDSVSAFMYAKGVKTDPLFTISYYLTANRQLVGVEQYTDASLTVKEGSSILLYANGKPRTLQTFKQNILQGSSVVFDSLQRPLDSMLFDNNKKVSHVRFQYHKNGLLKQRKEEDFLTNTTKELIMDSLGRMREEIFFDGKKGFYKTYKENGEIASNDKISTLQTTSAEFPGGVFAWRNFLERTLRPSELIKRKIPPGSYTVYIKFIVNEKGELSDFSTTSATIGYGAEEEAIRVMRNSPNWIPAKKMNKPVKAYRVQPITFNIM